MTHEPEAPLDPPPRKAHLRRGTRNVRRTYRTVFALVILVFGGWVVLDALSWSEVAEEQRWLTVGFGVAALLTLIVWRFVERPLSRDLRLARRGVVAQGVIRTIGKPQRKRASVVIEYVFRTAAGAEIEGECLLPRRFPVQTIAPEMTIEVLYDPKYPWHNKPRFALHNVDFGDVRRKR